MQSIIHAWTSREVAQPVTAGWAVIRQQQKMRPFTTTKVLAERVGDLAPTEGRRDNSQDCLHDMSIVGNAQLVWDCEQ